MRRFIAVIGTSGALAALAAGVVIAWRRDPRIGSGFVNSVVNPMLVGRGLAGGGRSEVGTLEHVGRRTGVQRLTPVHPEPIPGGYRFVVPLGPHSEWARNVLAAGHCRLQLHDIVYDLDEPVMVPANAVDDLPWLARALMATFGFEYLKLRTFGADPGSLVTPADATAAVEVASRQGRAPGGT